MFAYSIVLQALLLIEAPLTSTPFLAFFHYIATFCFSGSAHILTSLCPQNVWDFKSWKNLEANICQSVSSVTVLIQILDSQKNPQKLNPWKTPSTKQEPNNQTT